MNGACDVNIPRADWSRELKVLGGFAAVFVLLYFLPVGVPRFDQALKEGQELTKWYAQEHVLLCLVPALFIAGAIRVFINQASVMRYLGPKASKTLAYGVASVSGTILAVCSCTVLPLFGSIWMRGAGLGPATAFLYSGPAINVLAIVMTARILGMELGAARAIGATAFSVVVGLAMHLAFQREEQAKAEAAMAMPELAVPHPLWQNALLYFSSLVHPDLKAEEAKVCLTDWASGNLVPGTMAHFLYGMDARGRPTIQAFAEKSAASKEQQSSPGNLVNWTVLRSKELATRCAFCDRAVYPEDACGVKFGTTHGYGCCTHCSMGVAARLKQDIEVEAKDGLTGESIREKTLEGQMASLEPATALAWFGQKKGTDGKWTSAGCFKQAFFINETNLKRWLEARPAMTGRQISVAQALADKMKLSPEQIAKACKLGECK